MWLGLQDQQTPSPVLLTTPPGSLRGPGALPQLAQRAFSVVATLRILTGFLLTYKLVSCFLSRDFIALVLPETKTREAADLRGQQPCSPCLGPSGFGADLLPVPSPELQDPHLTCHCCGPISGSISSESGAYLSSVGLHQLPYLPALQPSRLVPDFGPPLTLAFSYRTHPTPVLMFHGSG